MGLRKELQTFLRHTSLRSDVACAMEYANECSARARSALAKGKKRTAKKWERRSWRVHALLATRRKIAMNA